MRREMLAQMIETAYHGFTAGLTLEKVQMDILTAQEQISARSFDPEEDFMEDAERGGRARAVPVHFHDDHAFETVLARATDEQLLGLKSLAEAGREAELETMLEEIR